jgi:hypothetical protein
MSCGMDSPRAVISRESAGRSAASHSRTLALFAAIGLLATWLAAPPVARATDVEPLRGQWHLDEGATGPNDTVIFTPDSSGHGLDGVVRFMDAAAGRFAGAFHPLGTRARSA